MLTGRLGHRKVLGAFQLQHLVMCSDPDKQITVLSLATSKQMAQLILEPARVKAEGTHLLTLGPSKFSSKARQAPTVTGLMQACTLTFPAGDAQLQQ